MLQTLILGDCQAAQKAQGDLEQGLEHADAFGLRNRFLLNELCSASFGAAVIMDGPKLIDEALQKVGAHDADCPGYKPLVDMARRASIAAARNGIAAAARLYDSDLSSMRMPSYQQIVFGPKQTSFAGLLTGAEALRSSILTQEMPPASSHSLHFFEAGLSFGVHIEQWFDATTGDVAVRQTLFEAFCFLRGHGGDGHRHTMIVMPVRAWQSLLSDGKHTMNDRLAHLSPNRQGRCGMVFERRGIADFRLM